MITSNMTVREVAVQLPESTRLFEKLNIDYCCGGNLPLTEACASAGVEVDKLIEMLGTVSTSGTGGRIDFQNLSLSELINHIVDVHHTFTTDELERIERLTAKVISAHGENHPELLRLGMLVEQLCADLRPHMFKEERVLFPYVVELDRAGTENRPAPLAPFGTVRNPVRMMNFEHDAAGEILRELRQATSDYTVPPDGCITYKTLYEALEALEKDLHQHIHLENNLLFPRAIELEAKLHG